MCPYYYTDMLAWYLLFSHAEWVSDDCDLVDFVYVLFVLRIKIVCHGQRALKQRLVLKLLMILASTYNDIIIGDTMILIFGVK